MSIDDELHVPSPEELAKEQWFLKMERDYLSKELCQKLFIDNMLSIHTMDEAALNELEKLEKGVDNTTISKGK